MPRKKGVPFARDTLKKPRNFSLTHKGFEGLGRLMHFLKFQSISALLEALGRGELFISHHPHTFEDLMMTWDMDDLAEQAGIPIERLIDIRDGKGEQPDPSELIGLARATGIKFEMLKTITNKGTRQSNGC